MLSFYHHLSDLPWQVAYARKLADTTIVLNAREEKILLLTKTNDDLAEANAILRNQVTQHTHDAFNQ